MTPSRTEQLVLAVAVAQLVGVAIIWWQLERANRSLDSAEKTINDTARDVQQITQKVLSVLPR